MRRKPRLNKEPLSRDAYLALRLFCFGKTREEMRFLYKFISPQSNGAEGKEDINGTYAESVKGDGHRRRKSR